MVALASMAIMSKNATRMKGTKPAKVKMLGRNVRAESVRSKKYEPHVLQRIAEIER